MQPLRLQQVEEIYHDVIGLSPSEQQAFLDERCGSDDELRQEVLSLLAFHDSGEGLIDTSPQEFAARMFDSGESDAQLIGSSVGPYHILSFIGSGGMGRVFLAEDSRLSRKVALKIIQDDLVANPDQRRRFEREAQTVSRLNHPNIFTVYEFGVENDIYYLAAEHVEGDTLRQLIARDELSPERSIDVIEQVGSALTAAHNAGIVHRDIKPENVMIRPDGIVKLLDFGLAKTVRVTDEDSVTMAKTRPGLIMGTVAYMSPEQTRGVATDERTDIWSLGAVLYEMLTGEVPFKGETSSDVIASILRSDPIAPTSIVPSLPALFDSFFERTLSKDKEKRFASIDEMLSELVSLKASLASVGSTTTGKRWNPSSKASTTEQRASLKTLPAANSKETKSSGSLKWFAAAALLIVASPAAAYFAWSRLGSSASSPPSISRVQKRLTTYGDVTSAVISPDGKSVAYISKQGTATSLLVQQIESSEFVMVLPPVSDYIRQITFSPDNRYIYFLRQYDRRQSFMILFRVPVTGGEPEQILFDVDHGVSFSPDGMQMVFRRESLDEKLSRIFIANIDGSNERLLAERTRPDGFMNSPVWSPDGKTIASNVNDPTLSSLEFAVVAINVASGEVKPIGTSHWRWVEGLAWDPSGDALILTAQETAARPDQLLRISYPSGEVSRITDDFNRYRGATASADGSQIVSVQNRQDLSLFVGSADAPDTARRVLAIQGLSYYGIAFAPNGSIIYSCNADGNRQIWSVRADGTERKMLTRDETVKDRPAVSSDGRYIVFRNEQDTRGSIMRMNLDGGEITELTSGPSDTDPTVSSDSLWVFYTSSAGGRTQPMLWKVSINGGTPVQVTTGQTVSPEASPDGKFIAGYYLAPSLEGDSVLTLFDAETGEVKRVTTVRNSKFQWRPNFASPSLVNLNDEVANIESFSFEKNISTKLSSFTTGQITDFTYSADGKQIAMIRGSVTNSIVVLTAAR